MNDFPVRLKGFREKLKDQNKKWTQQYVADKIGVARVTYTAYENGTKMPPFDTINKIAELFEVTTDYLMGRSDDPRLTKDEDVKANERVKELMELLKDKPDDERARLEQRILDYAKGLTDAD